MKFGSYDVVGPIGRGGAGVVLRARSAEGRDVAIKVLEGDDRPDRRARFERERRLLAALGEAEGFVPLLDFIATPRGDGIVMPFVGGGTLRQRLARPLPIEATLDLARALAKALAAAHARGIVHRDLKPENILFTATGRPLVADLGLAKHFRHDSPGASHSVRVSMTGAFLGTAGYMPPEQFMDASKVDASADVFSLGAIVYECLAGQPAFSGGTLVEVVQKTEECRPEPLAKLRPDAPRELVAVVARCLARDPAARFADAGALAEALEASALEAPAPDEVRRGGAWRWSLAAFGVVALLAVVAAFTLSRHGASPSDGTPVASSAAPRPAGPETASLESRAAAQLASWQLRAAAATAAAAIARDPRSVAAHAIAGEAKVRRRDWSGIADLDRALELAPDDVRLLVLRGAARIDAKDLAGARADLEKARKLAPRSAPVVRELARLTLKEHDLPAADALAAEAIALDPNDASAYEVHAAAGILQTRVEAHLDLDRVVALDPERATAWIHGRGVIEFLPGGSFSDAMATYAYRGNRSIGNLVAHLATAPQPKPEEIDELCRSAPKVALGPFLRARFMPQGPERARQRLAEYDRVVALAPHTAASYAVRADCYLELQDYKRANEDLDRAIDLDARDPFIWEIRSHAEREVGHLDAAIEDLDRAIEVEPKPEDLIVGRAALRPASASPGGEAVIYEDSFRVLNPSPTDGPAWEWLESDPAPHSGALALHAPHLAGSRGLELGLPPLLACRGESVVVWVHLDPKDPPREVAVVLSSDRWARRCYWGEDRIEFEGARQAMGPLPAPGEWTKLEVAFDAVGIAPDALVRSMALFVHGGRATFDHIAKTSGNR